MSDRSPDQKMLPTPPTSHYSSQASRRRLNTSEESTKSTSSSSSAKIDDGDIHRIGFPKDLPALPLETAVVKESPELSRQLQPLIINIYAAAGKAGVTFDSVSLVHRFEPGEVPTDDDLTLFIRSKKHSGWITALSEIDSLFVNLKIPWKVEILDDRANQHYFPAHLSPQAAAAWPQIEINILAILGYGSEWQSLTMLNRGNTENESSPTVVIGLRKSAPQDWQKSIYSDIRDVLHQFPEIEIGFMRAFTNFIGDPSFDLDDLSAVQVHLGGSIGLPDRVGTLGGYVTVQSASGQVERMGLTNAHVVENSFMSKGERIVSLIRNSALICW